MDLRKLFNKISDITYEIVNQDGYTSHIHRNHLVPYYPKEPFIFPFLQQYNPHLLNDNSSIINDPIKSFDSDENQFSDEDQFSSTKFNKETDIPSTIDFQPESFSQYSSFPYQEKEQDSKNTNSDNQSDIHDYDNFINPRRHSYNRYNFRPQPRKDYRLFLGEKIYFHFLKNPAEIQKERKFERKKESLKLNVKLNERKFERKKESFKLNVKLNDKNNSQVIIKERNSN